ncbi:hypothetical protein F4777DRAFT_474181 [Nemania sp. FL0916]|nr:hypothetical protein F4777DRAFT_474181 [Nemania sp. FL0916]
MDPVSIVQIVGTIVSLSDRVLKCISQLRALNAKYQGASGIIRAVTEQLSTVQVAIDLLKVWIMPGYDRDPRYLQLARQIGNSFDGLSQPILALEQQLEDFASNTPENITAEQKIKFLWREKAIAEYSTLLNVQVNALNLLLQVAQCDNWAQRQDIMRRKESQVALEKAKDLSSSIISLKDSSSFITDDTAGISKKFEFDAFLLGSRIYQRAERSHLQQTNRATFSAPSPNADTFQPGDQQPIQELQRSIVDRSSSSQKEVISPTVVLESLGGTGLQRRTRRARVPRYLRLRFGMSNGHEAEVSGVQSRRRSSLLLVPSGWSPI